MSAEPTSDKVNDSHERVDISVSEATLEWIENLDERLTPTIQACFDCEVDPVARIAGFRLRVGLQCQKSNKETPVYLIIHPKDICSVEADSASPEGDATCLRIQLETPATFVTPPFPLHFKDGTQIALFKRLQSAARQRALAIRIPGGLSPSQLAGLGEVTYHNFENGRHLDIRRLYGGRGGKVQDCTSVDTTTETRLVESPLPNSPPSYNELEGPPPMAPVVSHGSNAESSSKKRRLDSPGHSAPGFDTSLIEAICRKVVNEQIDERLQTELPKMEDRITTRLEELMNDKVSKLNETWQEQVEELETRLEQLSDDIDARVDYEVEDRVLGIKIDMEDFVKDEMKNTEETLRDRLTEASIYLQFND